MSIEYLRYNLEELKRERENKKREYEIEENNLMKKIEEEKYLLEKENRNLKNQKDEDIKKLEKMYNEEESNLLRRNLKKKYDLEYKRDLLKNELDSKNKNKKEENEHIIEIEKKENNFEIRSKYLDNILVEDLERLNIEKAKTDAEKKTKLEKIKIDNIEQK